jgi:hypothetical protein
VDAIDAAILAVADEGGNRSKNRARSHRGRGYQFFDRDCQADRPKAPYIAGMKRKTANIDIRVEPQLIEKIDAWRARQRISPSRAATIGYMLEHFLKHDRPEVSGALPTQECAGC